MYVSELVSAQYSLQISLGVAVTYKSIVSFWIQWYPYKLRSRNHGRDWLQSACVCSFEDRSPTTRPLPSPTDRGEQRQQTNVSRENGFLTKQHLRGKSRARFRYLQDGSLARPVVRADREQTVTKTLRHNIIHFGSVSTNSMLLYTNCTVRV